MLGGASLDHRLYILRVAIAERRLTMDRARFIILGRWPGF